MGGHRDMDPDLRLGDIDLNETVGVPRDGGQSGPATLGELTLIHFFRAGRRHPDRRVRIAWGIAVAAIAGALVLLFAGVMPLASRMLSLREQVAASRGRSGDLRGTLDRLAQSNVQLEADRAALNEQVESLQKENEELKLERDRLEADLRTLKQDYDSVVAKLSKTKRRRSKRRRR